MAAKIPLERLSASARVRAFLGEFIKEKARADRDELLYVIVDQAVRAVGAKTTAPVKK